MSPEIRKFMSPGDLESGVIKYKLINQFIKETGYSDAAIRAKIRDGVWIEGREYRRSPDGRIQISHTRRRCLPMLALTLREPWCYRVTRMLCLWTGSRGIPTLGS